MSKSLSLSPLSQVSLPLVRMNRILATSAGTDKVFMFYCYFSKVVVYALNSQRIGFGSKKALELAEKLTKLAAFTSDARVLSVAPIPLPRPPHAHGCLPRAGIDSLDSCPSSHGFNP